MQPKNKFFLFLTACVPGCGQMYLGYLKRGMCLTCAVCALFALSMGVYFDYLLVFVIPLWLFSYFDAWNLQRRLLDGTAEPDALLFGLTADGQKLAALARGRHSIIGWLLVAAGVCALYNMATDALFNTLSYYYGDFNWLYSILHYSIPRCAVSAVVIALGIWFLRGPKAAPAEDIPAFVPPAESEAEEAPHGEE